MRTETDPVTGTQAGAAPLGVEERSDEAPAGLRGRQRSSSGARCWERWREDSSGRGGRGGKREGTGLTSEREGLCASTICFQVSGHYLT